LVRGARVARASRAGPLTPRSKLNSPRQLAMGGAFGAGWGTTGRHIREQDTVLTRLIP
jgi:hypothetical protein